MISAGLLKSLTVAVSFALLSPSAFAEAPVKRPQVKPGQICPVMDSKACQDAVTPQQIIAALKDGNKRFVSGKLQAINSLKAVKSTTAGQYPLATIVSCIDARAPAETIFDQGIGDVFNARVAGNIVNEDILGSLEFASKVAGSKVIVVLGHTSCGAVKGACDDAQLGNLTGLLAKIKPAVAAVPDDGKARSSKNYAFVDKVAEANVHMTVQTIRDKSPVLKEMESKGEVVIVGAMYDVANGKVSFYDTKKN
jgi:carbonic anhydrase